MAEKITYKSNIAGWIDGFIQEKQALGYKYYNESKWMRSFDRYWEENGYPAHGLTQETVSGWLRKKESEGNQCLSTRTTVIREFSKYLNGIGIHSYYPRATIHYPKAVIHVPSDEEVTALFREIDAIVPGKEYKETRRMADEYPVLFRLIYLNGLRASEACFLLKENIYWESGSADILNGKGNTDRRIYLSDDMACLLRDYIAFIESEYGCRSRWVFPGRNPDNPVSYGNISAVFRKCWRKTSFADGCDRNPTTHSLRHAFIVKRITQWQEEGLDFDHMLPYLSSFLGHKSFNETFYYYHYVKEAALIIQKKDTVAGRVIPEVMRR